jgi:hypothetical protein
LKSFRVDLQQGCRLARIEEPLEMRERLTGFASCISLIKPPAARVETGLKSPRRLKVGCGVRLHPTDFESIHYSAGVSLRVMGGREYYSYRNRTRRILLLASQRIFFLVDFKTTSKLQNNFSRSA